jgi:hypothetical protein
MPFKQMENISNFIKACRALGVPEHGLFTTPDLYDGKSIVNVTNGIVALGSKAQTLPGYSGPTLGAGDSTANIGSYTKGKKSKFKVGSGGGGMTKMMAGSAGTMQRSANTNYRDISNGANASGKSVGGVTKMMAGSAGTMQRSANNGYRDITNGANASGKSLGGSTMLSQGSSQTMERSSNQNFRDITKGAQRPKPPPKPARPQPFKTAAWDYQRTGLFVAVDLL